MAKERVRPSPATLRASMSRRKMRTQKEWKVEMSGLASDEWPSSRSTRAAISLAALLVKVTARMESGATPFSRMSQAMRLVMTRVLPEPAPARMSRGPSVASTAARCSGFRLSMGGCKARVQAGRILFLVYPQEGQAGDGGVVDAAGVFPSLL